MRARVIALLAVAALGVGACGDDEGGSADLVPAIPAAAATETTTSPSTTGKPFKLSSIKVSTTKGKKPTITKPSGDPADEARDEGHLRRQGPGREGRRPALDAVCRCAVCDGKQFEASWDSGSRSTSRSAQGDVIPGWDQGIVGMKAGGRRLLVIPPELAYGAQGQGDIPPDAPLIFVVDVLKRTAG